MDAKPGVRLAQNGAGASEAAFAGGGDTDATGDGGDAAATSGETFARRLSSADAASGAVFTKPLSVTGTTRAECTTPAAGIDDAVLWRAIVPKKHCSRITLLPHSRLGQ